MGIQDSLRGAPPLPEGANGSLLAEGFAVGALVHGGIGLVGAHQDAVQRAVVLVLAVVCTLLDGAFDALVGMTVLHGFFLLLLGFGFSMAPEKESMR